MFSLLSALFISVRRKEEGGGRGRGRSGRKAPKEVKEKYQMMAREAKEKYEKELEAHTAARKAGA